MNILKKILFIVLILIVFFGSFYAHKLRVPKRRYADFHCFYVAGKRILNHENLYVLDNKDTGVAEFRYAPIFAVLMSGLALLSEDNADTVWYILNFCLLIASFIFLKKLIVPERLGYKSAFVLYTLLILGAIRFILQNFDTGQSNILMLASIIIGLYYISQKRNFLGAAIFAFSVMVKYTPLVFIPYFLLKRKIKLSFIIMGFVIMYLILPSLFIGFKANFIHLKNLIPFLFSSSILDPITILDPKNQSLFSFIRRLFTYCIAYFYAPHMLFESLKLTQQQTSLIFILSALIVYIAAIYNPRRKESGQQANIDYALLLICVVLFNLNAWMHNYLLLLMPYFIIVYYLIKNRFRDITILLLWLFSYFLNLITIPGLLSAPLTYKLHFYSPFTLSAILTFFALLKIKRAVPY